MRELRLPLTLAILGHAGVLTLLVWVANIVPPLPVLPSAPEQAIEIAFAPPPPELQPPLPVLHPMVPDLQPPVPDLPPPLPDLPPPLPDLAEPPPQVVEEPPPQVAEAPPPEPPPPPVKEEPPPPPPPPPKPVVHKPPPKPPVERRIAPQPMPAPAYSPPQVAAIPVPTPLPAPAPVAPTVSPNYRGMLSAWLEAHKRYPDSARARGEEGRTSLRFRVARNGQVLTYAVVGSSGYPDLDASVEAMMRGATLPPFPPEMTAPDIEVTVTIRFALAR